MNDIHTHFDDVYHLYYTPILRYMSKMVGPKDAADVAQEAFAKINRSMNNFEGRATLSTWIYRIATNSALDWLRSAQSKPPEIPLMKDAGTDSSGFGTHISPMDHDPLNQVIHSEMNECIREQVVKLPEKYRTVMILASLQELNNKEIAAVLEISLNTVKIRLHRARVMLKKILENECRFYSNPSTGALSCDRKVSPEPWNRS